MPNPDRSQILADPGDDTACESMADGAWLEADSDGETAFDRAPATSNAGASEDKIALYGQWREFGDRVKKAKSLPAATAADAPGAQAVEPARSIDAVSAAAEVLAESRKDFERKLASLHQRLDAVTNNFEHAREQVLADARSDHARELATLRREHAHELQQHIAATRDELERNYNERIAEALREANEAADARLTVAKESWQAGEERRTAAVRRELEFALGQLHEKLESTAERARQQAMQDAETAQAREIAALKRNHADELKKEQARTAAKAEQEYADRLAAAQTQWQAGADDRLAQALHYAKEKADQELAEARRDWAAEAEANLAQAREVWKREEGEHIAAALKARSGEGRATTKSRRRRAAFALRPHLWLPRRSLVVKAAAFAAVALVLMHPDVKSRIPEAKSFIAEQSAIAATEFRTYVGPLVAKLAGSESSPRSLPTRRGEPLAEDATRAIVEVASANIRSGPSTATAVTGSLGSGSEVALLDRQDGWYLVRFGEGANARMGWVYGQLLRN